MPPRGKRAKRATRGKSALGHAAKAPSKGIARAYARYLKIALALPLAVAGTSYGTPAVKVRGKLLSRWRTEAEGAVAIRCDFLDREIMLQALPEVFFLTDHYENYPMVLLRLDKAPRRVLIDVLERAWRRVAPAAAIRQRDGEPR